MSPKTQPSVVRLARMGTDRRPVATVTYEEGQLSRPWPWDQANGRVGLKGFLITWVVHSRAPAQPDPDVGLIRFPWWCKRLFPSRHFASIILPPFFLWTLLPFRFSVHHTLFETPLGLKHSIASLGFFVNCEILSIAIGNDRPDPGSSQPAKPYSMGNYVAF